MISRGARASAVLIAAGLIGALSACGASVPSRTAVAVIPRRLSALVAAHPEAFVGLGWEKDGTPVIAFDPGIDMRGWEGQLKRAAGSLVYQTRSWASTTSLVPEALVTGAAPA